jgi:hypothetical protein
VTKKIAKTSVTGQELRRDRRFMKIEDLRIILHKCVRFATPFSSSADNLVFTLMIVSPKLSASTGGDDSLSYLLLKDRCDDFFCICHDFLSLFCNEKLIHVVG